MRHHPIIISPYAYATMAATILRSKNQRQMMKPPEEGKARAKQQQNPTGGPIMCVSMHISTVIMGSNGTFFIKKKLAGYTRPRWVLKPMASSSILLLQREEMSFENIVHWHFLIN